MGVGLSDLSYDSSGMCVGKYEVRHTRVTEGSFVGFHFKDGVCLIDGGRQLRKLVAAVGQDLQIRRIDVEPPAPPVEVEVEAEASEPEGQPPTDALLAMVREFVDGLTREQLVNGAARAAEAPETLDDATLRKLMLADFARARDEFRAQFAGQADQEIFDAAAEMGIPVEGVTDAADVLERLIEATMLEGLTRAQAELAESKAEGEAGDGGDGKPAEAAAESGPVGLEAMDKAALMALAEQRGMKVDGRWGEARMRETIAEAAKLAKG